MKNNQKFFFLFFTFENNLFKMKNLFFHNIFIHFKSLRVRVLTLDFFFTPLNLDENHEKRLKISSTFMHCLFYFFALSS